MRRMMLAVALGGLVGMLLLCGAGTVRAWSTAGHELVMPGAGDVRIDRDGIFRLHVTYQLPKGSTLHDLAQYLTQRGWRRIRFPNADRSIMSFARTSWATQLREIAVVTLDSSDRHLAEIRFSRCLNVRSWVNCM